LQARSPGGKSAFTRVFYALMAEPGNAIAMRCRSGNRRAREPGFRTAPPGLRTTQL